MKDPDTYQILVTRGKDAPWVAEIVCDLSGEVNISLGTGQTVMLAIESAWVLWRTAHPTDALNPEKWDEARARASRPEEGVVAPPEADVPLPFGD